MWPCATAAHDQRHGARALCGIDGVAADSVDLAGRWAQAFPGEFLDVEVTENLPTDIQRCVLVACGTAWHACLVGKFLLERLAGIPCEVTLNPMPRSSR